MFRQTLMLCIAASMVLSVVSYSQAQEENPDEVEIEVSAEVQERNETGRSGGRRSSRYGREGGYGGGGGYGVGGGYGAPNPFGETPFGQSRGVVVGRSRATQTRNRLYAVLQVLAKAETEEAKQEARTELREVLTASFNLDLEKRQSVLADIKNRVEAMESQLRKRVNAKQKIIDLRMQVLLNNAEGLGWVGEARESSRGPFDVFGGGGRNSRRGTSLGGIVTRGAEFDINPPAATPTGVFDPRQFPIAPPVPLRQPAN